MLGNAIYDLAHFFDSIPLLMVYGSDAISAESAQDFFDTVNGPKQLLVINGAGHFDLYWMPE